MMLFIGSAQRNSFSVSEFVDLRLGDGFELEHIRRLHHVAGVQVGIGDGRTSRPRLRVRLRFLGQER